VDGCCDGQSCTPEEHRRHHTFSEKLAAGIRFALGDLWGDLAGWFMVGLVLAGLITVLVPADLLSKYLGTGLPAMLLMLVIGIPMYICATASTPIAAALILKGVSPGAALVFLLAGPATNLASLTVLTGVLGKRAAGIYLASIVVFGLAVDQVYAWLGVSAQAMAGRASQILPQWSGLMGAIVILGMSLKPIWEFIMHRFKTTGPAAETQLELKNAEAKPEVKAAETSGCGPT
jgi:hypothetical protein